MTIERTVDRLPPSNGCLRSAITSLDTLEDEACHYVRDEIPGDGHLEFQHHWQELEGRYHG
jgi:hypothetical protein